MRWATYLSARDGTRHVAAVHEGRLYARPAGERLIDLLGDDGARLRVAHEKALSDPVEVVQETEAGFCAPIPVPPSIRDFMAFEEHVRPILAARGASVDPAWYQVPAFYFTNPAAVLGPRDEVRAAPGANELDFELEVAAVIGRPGSDLAPSAAVEHIAGYLLMCDWSARDLQRRERPLGLGPVKGKDWATSFGPYFVSADELPAPPGARMPDLRLRASVNGRHYSDGNLNEAYWSFAEMVAYASRGTTVRPGDVIGSGTVGTGCIADLSARHGGDAYPWLRPCDRIELDGGALGRISCVLGTGAAVVPLRPEGPQ